MMTRTLRGQLALFSRQFQDTNDFSQVEEESEGTSFVECESSDLIGTIPLIFQLWLGWLMQAFTLCRSHRLGRTSQLGYVPN